MNMVPIFYNLTPQRLCIFNVFGLICLLQTATSQLNLQSVLSVRKASFCEAGVCLNGGVCKEVTNQGFFCKCRSDFFGDRCEKVDPCHPNPCAGGSECVQNPTHESGFNCKCRQNLVGDRCQVFCPAKTCINNGTCSFNIIDKLHCICPPGFTGRFCDKLINLCSSNPCVNGDCSELGGGQYFCQCYEGWMGKNCDRPCRDIYKSCNQWKKADQCDAVRTRTNFFDLNCARSCQKCIFRNETVVPGNPLPPVLEPLSWMVGKWASASNIPARYPVDFSAQARHAYIEILNIQPAPVTMFGTPSISFTSTSQSATDASDIRYNIGYLTVREHTLPVQIALLCTSNEGMTTIEKGVVDDSVLLLNMTYMQIHPALKLKQVPLGGTRLFQKLGKNRLVMTVKKLQRDSSILQFTKKYNKIKEYSL